MWIIFDPVYIYNILHPVFVMILGPLGGGIH